MVPHSTVNVMYKLKPVFKVPTTFKNTSSMYKLKPIKCSFQPDLNTCTNKNIDGEPENDSKVDLDKIAAIKLENVIVRQGKLLEALTVLKERIHLFSNQQENSEAQDTSSISKEINS